MPSHWENIIRLWSCLKWTDGCVYIPLFGRSLAPCNCPLTPAADLLDVAFIAVLLCVFSRPTGRQWPLWPCWHVSAFLILYSSHMSHCLQICCPLSIKIITVLLASSPYIRGTLNVWENWEVMCRSLHFSSRCMVILRCSKFSYLC